MMAGALPTFAQVNVITQHNDIARTGQNLSETVLTPSNVNDTHFGLLHKIALDDQCYANPLVYSGLTIGGVVHNVVYMATCNNSVYALDATTGAQLWHVNFGTAPTESCVNITGKSGIISTPVINAANSCIYVVSITSGAYGDGSGVLNFRLHKLDLVTGNEDAGSPVLITGTSFNPAQQNQRPALLDVNGKIYIGFGSHCDYTPSNGRIFAFDNGTLAKTAEFDNSVPGGSASLDSIWMAGQGPAADSSGNIYYITGNGTWDGVNNFGESIMKMSPTLGLSSYFTANDYANLNNNDLDLGSGGCMVMPGTGYIVGGGKTGKIYVLNPASLGGLSANDANAIQVFQAVHQPGGDTGHIHGAPAYFVNSTGPAIYVWGENDHGRCYQYVNGAFNTTASSVTTAVLPETNGPGMAGGNFAISANGTTNGIAWAYGVLSGDANSVTAGTVPGILFAFDANNLATQLWSSQDNPSRDSMGNLAKFSYPVIANGLVYVSDFGTTYSGTGGLCIYGPISGGGGTATTPCLTAANSNMEGMVTDGTTFPNTSGFDGEGYAYSATMLGSSITWNGLSFSLLPANANNGASNETITLPAGQFSTLSLLGSGMGGGQTNQTIKVNYTDGTNSTFTQSFSDWGIQSANYPGESTILTMSYRDTYTGGRDTRSIYVYGYSFALNSAKTVSSLVLPANRFVGIIAAGLSGGSGGEGAYGGTPAPIPGTVQAENYDTGGQGVAYNVTSVNGTDNGYRTDGVDLEVCSDTGGGVDVGWENPGQWFRYTVNVATAGTYTVSFRVAAPNAVTDAFHLSNSSGTNLSGNINVPATGGYQTWATVTASVTLPAGQQVLTVNQDTGGGVWNLNYMGFASSGGGTLLPTQNATVRSGAYANTNFNGATTIRVKNDAPDNTRHVYLTFDTSSMPTVSSAVIKLYVVGTGSTASRTITVYQQPTTSWLESTITWNNAPAAGTLIGTFNVSTTTGIYYNFDVTSYVQAQRAAGHNIVSVELIQNTDDVNGLVDFASREATTGQPGLTITP